MSMPFFYRICQPWGPFGSMDFRWFQPNGSIAERWTARRRGHTSRHSHSGQAAGHMVVFLRQTTLEFLVIFTWEKTESWLFVNVHDPIPDGTKISFDMFCRILKRWSWHCWDFPLDEKVRFSWPASMQSCPPSLCKKSSNVLRKPWFLHQKSIANDFTDFECIKK